MSHRFYFRAARVFSILFLVLILLGLAQTVSAVVELQISPSAIQRIPIAVPDFKYMTPEQSQLAREMSEVLSNDLNISGVFRPLDRKGFLEDPQVMGLEASEIKFQDWSRQGADFLARCSYQVQGNSIRLDGRLFDVAGRKMVGAPKSYSGELRAWRQMVHAFADDIMLMLTGERGVFNTKIAYVQNVGTTKEIFYCDFDGYNPVQVTRDNSIALSPTWSPDQSQIAFLRSTAPSATRAASANFRTRCSATARRRRASWNPSFTMRSASFPTWFITIGRAASSVTAACAFATKAWT